MSVGGPSSAVMPTIAFHPGIHVCLYDGPAAALVSSFHQDAGDFVGAFSESWRERRYALTTIPRNMASNRKDAL